MANPGHVKAARLRESGIEWTIALEKAEVPDTDLARKSVSRIIRKTGSKAKAKAKAKSDDAALRAKRRDLKAREVALQLAAELRAKRKDLKARETALELARRDLKSPLKRGCALPTNPGGAHTVDLTAEPPGSVSAVKAKLMVARRTLREANKNKGRVKKQGQGMSKKLKGAREAGRRVLDLEREVAGLREDVAGARAAAAPPGGREEELFNYSRDHSQRGGPYQPVFAEVIGPAMLSTGASGAQITEILRLNELRFFEPGMGPSEPPGCDWWQDRRHVAGAMSEAYAWYCIATAKSLLQGGSDETKIDRLSRLNLWLVRHDEGGEREVFNMGTCKVLIDGTAEGVRQCVETMFKRGQFIVMRLRSLLAAAGHDPDDFIPLVDGGCLPAERA